MTHDHLCHDAMAMWSSGHTDAVATPIESDAVVVVIFIEELKGDYLKFKVAEFKNTFGATKYLRCSSYFCGLTWLQARITQVQGLMPYYQSPDLPDTCCVIKYT